MSLCTTILSLGNSKLSDETPQSKQKLILQESHGKSSLKSNSPYTRPFWSSLAIPWYHGEPPLGLPWGGGQAPGGSSGGLDGNKPWISHNFGMKKYWYIVCVWHTVYCYEKS